VRSNETRTPPGGKIVKNQDGNPTGWLIDATAISAAALAGMSCSACSAANDSVNARKD
jgi:predicted amidohydrolase YtcJ